MSFRDKLSGRTSRRTVLRKGAIGGTIGVLGLSSVSRTGADDGPTTITEPTNIEEPGEYVLGDDLTVEDRTGLYLDSWDVTLDGNGYRIEGGGNGTGLSISEGRRCTVRNLTIENFERGIVASGGENTNISSVTVQDNSESGLVVTFEGEVHCEDSTIRRNGEDGILIHDYSSATVRNCEIVENGTNPIWGGSSAPLVVEDCRILDNGGPVFWRPLNSKSRGIPLDSRIEGTHISGSEGAGLQTRFGDGPYMEGPTRVRNCVIRDNDGPGIDQDAGWLNVQRCSFTGNRVGYQVRGSDPRETILRNNNIEDNEEYGVLHTEREKNPLVDAKCNWWGDESGPVHEDNPNETPQGDRVSNGVEFTPWSVERIEDGEASCEGGLGEDVLTRGEGFISRKSYRKLMGVGPYEDEACWGETFYVTDSSDIEADGHGGPGEFSLPTPYCDEGEEKQLRGHVIRAESEAVPVTLPTWGGDRGDCESLLFVDAEQTLPADVEYRAVPTDGPMLSYEEVETNGFAGEIDALVWVSFELAHPENSESEGSPDE